MSEIKIQIQIRTLLDLDLWGRYCDKYEVDPYALREGLTDSDEWVPVTVEVENIKLV